jgi:hypothetical protein
MPGGHEPVGRAVAGCRVIERSNGANGWPKSLGKYSPIAGVQEVPWKTAWHVAIS